MIKVALIGNPNTGKTSLFNRLTGLNQKVGNYPGITVDKKVGHCKLSENVQAEIIDLPGTYSLNSTSLDEDVAVNILSQKDNDFHPEVIVVVVDVENLKRNLLLYTQIKDLQIPTILAINMADQMAVKGIDLDINALENLLKTKIALISTKKNTGITYLKKLIHNYQQLDILPCFLEKETIMSQFANTEQKKHHLETVRRYQFIKEILDSNYKINGLNGKDLRAILDRLLMHKFYGYIMFLIILFSIFQALFTWSSIPMDYIDSFFAYLSELSKNNLSPGVFTNLLSEGIIPGIGGVLIFVPQIAFLFLFLSILEETGYMSRVVFLMDKIMRRFGLSGKSVVPLISGTACAIPAIMSARNIENWRERLITILVTPLTTCSARIPVYAIIISLVIPNEKTWFSFNLQGIVLMALYILGFVMAFLGAFIFNKILKKNHKSYFVIEMPNYKLPLFKNVFYNVLEKTKAFVFDAGKIILAFSVLLWVLASNGPKETFSNAAHQVITQQPTLKGTELNVAVAAYKLENSYIGNMGKFIEPVIKPLGYDWKIGVAIITSFAAREVFVGTLATIYSVGSDEQTTIKNKMKNEINPITKEPVFTFASGISILLFYAFAMQCMSTIAIVKRETNSWKWPMIQLLFMSILAYVAAFIFFQLLK